MRSHRPVLIIQKIERCIIQNAGHLTTIVFIQVYLAKGKAEFRLTIVRCLDRRASKLVQK